MTYRVSSWSKRIDEGVDPHSPSAPIGYGCAIGSWKILGKCVPKKPLKPTTIRPCESNAGANGDRIPLRSEFQMLFAGSANTTVAGAPATRPRRIR
jgi:hypothetical protein